MRLERSCFSFSQTTSSVGFPLNFETAIMLSSTFLKLIPSWFGSGNLDKVHMHSYVHKIQRSKTKREGKKRNNHNSYKREKKFLKYEEIIGSPLHIFLQWKNYLNGDFGGFIIKCLSEDWSSHWYLLWCGIFTENVPLKWN